MQRRGNRAGRARTATTVAVIAGLASGCVSQGFIEGRLTNVSQPSLPAIPVVLAYETDRFGNGGTLSATLPDGEHYSGRFLQITTATTADAFSWGWGPGPYWGGGGPYWGGGGPYWGGGAPFWGGGVPYWGGWGAFGPGVPNDWTAFVQNYSGRAVATLFGDRQHTMRCRLDLANPAVGISGGGVGDCRTSDGGQIEVQF